MNPPSLRHADDTVAYFAAAIGGGTLWVLTSLLTENREAWDSPLYWSLTYPLCILASGFLGYLVPRSAWRWGLTIMFVQALVMLLLCGGSFGVLPLGLVLFGILALPCMAAATMTAAVRRHVEGW